MRSPELERKAFLLLLAGISAALLWVVFPMFGAVLWAVTFSIVFDSLNRALRKRFKLGPTGAAIATTLLVLVVVILPAVITTGFIVQEGSAVLQRFRSGEIDVAAYYGRLMSALPSWVSNILQNAGLKDLPAVQAKLRESAVQGSQPIATQVWALGQNALDLSVDFLVMLYLLFFLLRDGDRLMQQIRRAVPLEAAVQQRLYRNFSTVVRSTVKGNVVVAVIQGALGGVALAVLGIPGALLWGVVMAFLSLLPAIGAALVWGPIAVYLMVTGDLWRGIGLALFGTLVIGLVDNLLRPILVGKETKMPDYVVLISTIGGLSMFGLNGFVIGPVVAALFIAAWDLSVEDAGST